MRPALSSILGSVAGHGLPGSIGEWPDAPLDQSAWSDLVQHVARQRLSGLLVEAIAAGALPTTPEQSEQASELHFGGLCDVLLIESACLHVLSLLEARGVDVRILKGSAVAHLDYPDPSLRLFGDVDLLVRGDDFAEAVEVLTAAGYRRRFPEPRPGYDRRFSKGTSFTTSNGLEIDLHRTFVMGPFGLRLSLDDVWEQSTQFQLAGRVVRALDPDVRFLHACFHAGLGDVVPRLVPQRDIAQMLLAGHVDVDRVERLTRAWRAEPVVALAIATTWERLRIADLTRLSEWARHYVPDRKAVKELALYHDPHGSYAAKQLAALGALPRLRDKLAFATALTFPKRSYVNDRHAGRGSRWRKAAEAVRSSSEQA